MKRFMLAVTCALALLAPVSAESGKPPVFALRLVADGPADDTEQMSITHQTNGATSTENEVFHVQKQVLLDETDVASAQLQQNTATGYHSIEITFTEKGKQRFAEVTRQNIGRQLAIVVDGRLLSTPRIMAEIREGKALITGRFSEQESYELAKRINAAVAAE